MASLNLLLIVAALTGFANALQTPLLGCQNACSQFTSAFSAAAVHYPGNDSLIVWDAKQQEVRSACRVTPVSSQQVQRIMDILVNNWCRFAVKGGGHARNADDSISDGGVTVDMVSMKSIEVAQDRASAKVGSGHVLYTLYTGLEKHNLSTIGGRVADVGLGGYVLGGGISNFSPPYGLAVDNVFEYEIVLPNATLVTVNETSHPDLYFALRGGMNNFGIVTHFTMRTFSQGQLYSGNVAYSADKRDIIVDQAHLLTTTWKNDTDLTFSYGYSYNQTTDEFAFSMTQAYAKPILDPLPFRVLNNVSTESSTLRVDWMSNFALEGASGLPPGGRNLFATISYYPSAQLEKALQDIFAEEIQPIRNISGFFPNLIFQPLPEAAIQAGHERGGSALGIEADGPLSMVLLTVLWTKAVDDEAAYAFSARFVQRIKQATVDAGKEHRWMYINYANQQQDPFSGYGEANKQRLIQIQKSVDPMGVFTSRGLCRGYFKLW